tara:strand:- start:502 stop:858 length:357 start_codon:yes stop_codon:yes gene_type:complete
MTRRKCHLCNGRQRCPIKANIEAEKEEKEKEQAASSSAGKGDRSSLFGKKLKMIPTPRGKKGNSSPKMGAKYVSPSDLQSRHYIYRASHANYKLIYIYVILMNFSTILQCLASLGRSP